MGSLRGASAVRVTDGVVVEEMVGVTPDRLGVPVALPVAVAGGVMDAFTVVVGITVPVAFGDKLVVSVDVLEEVGEVVSVVFWVTV